MDNFREIWAMTRVSTVGNVINITLVPKGRLSLTPKDIARHSDLLLQHLNEFLFKGHISMMLRLLSIRSCHIPIHGQTDVPSAQN